LQPVKLASANEKASMLKKKNEIKRFFEDMEANIINKVCLPACLSVCLSVKNVNGTYFSGFLWSNSVSYLCRPIPAPF
jgi:hypothetical protein